MLLLMRCHLRATGQSTGIIQQLRHQILNLGDEPIAPAKLLNGHDLIALGATPGIMVGQLDQELYLAQLEGEVKTTSQAQKWVRHWLNKHQKKT